MMKLSKGNLVEFYDLAEYKKHVGTVQKIARPYYIVRAENESWIISWNETDKCWDGGKVE